MDALTAARATLIRRPTDPAAMSEFLRLPENVATLDAMSETARQMKDPKQFERITAGWRDYFRSRFNRIAEVPS